MKAFRNTGIEGGYGSIATQNWLLNIHRKTNPRGVFRTTKGKFEPVKEITGKSYNLHKTTIEALIEYSRHEKPVFCKTWAHSNRLAALGYLEMVRPPERFASRGNGEWQAFGALFQITQKGRNLIAEMTARGESK